MTTRAPAVLKSLYIAQMHKTKSWLFHKIYKSLSTLVDGDEDKRKIIGWRWATWFDPPIKYIQTSDPPPRHCGLHIECCSCWTGWWCIFCGYWQTFVTTKWLCLVQNELQKWSWSYTLIRWTSCSRQATVFQKLQKENHFFKGGCANIQSFKISEFQQNSTQNPWCLEKSWCLT